MDARDIATMLEESKRRTRELFALLRSTRELGEEAARAIEKTASEVERRFAREEHTVLIVGESADRHALLDAILGESVFARVQREAKTTTRVRSRPVIGYEANLRGGAIESFRESVPEREEAFGKAIARAERDRVAAEDEARELAAEIEAEQRSAKTVLIEMRGRASRLRAIWAWLLAWVFAFFSRAPRPAPFLEIPPALDLRTRDAAERVAKATVHREKLEADRDLYAVERQRSFFAALRTLADELSRGGEVTELTIEVASPDLVAGITLVNAPMLRADDGIDGCLFITSGAPATREKHAPLLDAIGPLATRSIAPGARPPEVRRAIEEIRRIAPLVVGEKAIALARRSIGTAIDDSARAETVCHERIAAIEHQRLADPAEFRARSLARMEKSIDDGARDVIRGALSLLPPQIEALKAEWRDALFACADRRAVEACVQSIRDQAPTRISALVDAINDFVVSEMQRTSDTAQLWLREEIQARYQLARRASAGEGPAPVITDVGSGEFNLLDGAPFDEAMDAFEHGRVGYGLGGAAAGAVLGTLVAPVIGTAIGAFLGVFAGLLKGVDSLKQDCAAKIDACTDESAEQIRAQLESRHPSLAGALRASLEDAIDTTMQRFARSIARLIELERKTLAAEREKLARLADLRASLDAHEAHFAALAARARASLPPRAAV